jgi:thiopeptide-type bacteriocin biosynthesis protein
MTAHPESDVTARVFIPGDEWVYFKLYCGAKTADQILAETLLPCCRELLATRAVARWFFIRYSDPKHHLRMRFHATGSQGVATVLARVHAAIKPHVTQDLVWKVQLDTYLREVERYGVSTMELGEELFFHDSEAVAACVCHLLDDETEPVRWRLALRMLDAFLGDFGFTPSEKLQLVTIYRDGFAREFNLNQGLKDQLDAKYRSERVAVERALQGDAPDDLTVFEPILQARSAAIKPLAADLLARRAVSSLDVPLPDLIGSYLHMTNNRLFRSKGRVHELVLYDFLQRVYKSAAARQKYAAS